ncbi:hypothetical protein [Mesorhizobium neociceri]|nr:hypothetical protein [Mesorhizobium neociceri]
MTKGDAIVIDLYTPNGHKIGIVQRGITVPAPLVDFTPFHDRFAK